MANVFRRQAKVSQKMLVDLGKVEALQIAVVPPRQKPQMQPAQDENGNGRRPDRPVDTASGTVLAVIVVSLISVEVSGYLTRMLR
nr:hypothetical protein [Mesorhizobium sp.]